jgi:1-acyl-sn-glycerol-3-phosphate acyltransferase
MRVADPSRRDRFVDAILRFLVDQDLLDASDIRVELEREIDAAGPDAVLDLKSRLETDHGWNYYPRDRLAHCIHHRLADRFLDQGSTLCGVNHITGLIGAPIVCLANHLSYADANVIEVLLHRAGAEEIANRLTALAGPKVFTSRDRRFSSLCFGTVKVPQSAEVSSGEAALNARAVAVAARRSIDAALERLRSGDALLLFPEGTRSRTGVMQAMLPGVARYLAVPGTWVVPLGLSGTEQLFSVNDSRLQPARVIVQIGDPVLADTLRVHARADRSVMMNAIGLAIAELLPASYRGAYGDPDRYVEAARVLRESRGTAQV